jgi:hypothetical protein
MRRRWLVIAVILTVAQGCDYVTWGGVQVRLEDPPSRDRAEAESLATEPAEPEPAETEPGGPTLPTGPFLLAGTRSGSRATLTVVGEIRSDALTDFPSDRAVEGYRDHFAERLLAPGTEFVLFSEGVRVGRLVAESTSVDSRYCMDKPSVSGTVELVPSASGATQLLAIPAQHVRRRPYLAHRSLDHTSDQRVASLRLATEAIPRVGATWPVSVLGTRADIRVFQLPGSATSTIAASFLHQDRLAAEAAPAGAYSIFLLGEMSGDTYQTSYTWYRPVATEGKGAPRFYDHLDLDGDGSDEVILEVFGRDSRWFVSLARRNGAWTTAFQESCGRSSPSP